MSVKKYLDSLQKDGWWFHRADLDGIPFRGGAFPIKSEEYYQVTQVDVDTYVKVFDTSVEKDLNELQEIYDRAANGWYRIIRESQKWVQDKGKTTLKVFLVWCVPYRTLRPDKKPQVGSSLNNNGDK